MSVRKTSLVLHVTQIGNMCFLCSFALVLSTYRKFLECEIQGHSWEMATKN